MNFGMVDSDSGILLVSETAVEPGQKPSIPPCGFSANVSGASRFLANSPATKIIKKKKRPVTFERRFISARGKSSNCKLGVAMVWRDTVSCIDQFDAKAGGSITVRSDPNCHYKVALENTSKIAIVQCINGSCKLLFYNAYGGFVLVGDNKIALDHFAAGCCNTSAC